MKPMKSWYCKSQLFILHFAQGHKKYLFSSFHCLRIHATTSCHSSKIGNILDFFSLFKSRPPFFSLFHSAIFDLVVFISFKSYLTNIAKGFNQLLVCTSYQNFLIREHKHQKHIWNGYLIRFWFRKKNWYFPNLHSNFTLNTKHVCVFCVYIFANKNTYWKITSHEMNYFIQDIFSAYLEI